VSVDADTGPTWTSFAADYFETYCLQCHGPGDVLRDYSDLAMVRAESARIRSGTASGQFPIGSGPFPSDEQRDLLVAWIDAGTPE
jgi:mono/diheme cytochrome c family protein